MPLLFKRSPEAESELMQLDQHHREEDVPHDDGSKGAVARGMKHRQPTRKTTFQRNACQVSSLNLSAIMGTSHTSR